MAIITNSTSTTPPPNNAASQPPRLVRQTSFKTINAFDRTMVAMMNNPGSWRDFSGIVQSQNIEEEKKQINKY